MYGTRLTSAFKDDTDAENLWETIVEQRDYSGAITEIEDAAPVPLKFTFADATKNIFAPTKISDVDFSVYATTRFQFVDLAVNDSLKNRIVTKFKGQIYWTGYIITELYEEPLELDSS
ncbi:hypothetical protein KAH94_06630, partial [bacterium]|nr:hypothetical protein [bacterium]